MIKKPLFLLFMLFGNSLLAQDSLVSFREISFQSAYEKSILTDYFISKKSDPFSLFMANGTLLREDHIEKDKVRFDDFLTALKGSDKFVGKKNDKKIKYLYEEIHKTFLQKYELQNKFEDIFYNGNYNCVSASALYALAFEQTGIPYILKEEPTHVYLIAYPEQERIIIETTTPLTGYHVIDQAFKESYIKMLKDQKVIGNREYTSQTVNILFDKYYFKNNADVTLLNVVGIQYMNDGVYNLEDKKYDQAFNQFQKAYLFYPSERVGYLMLMCCSQAFESRKEKDNKHAQYLAKLAHFKDYGITDEMITSEFYQVINKRLFENNNSAALSSYYQVLDSLLDEPKLKKEVAFAYQYENGRFLYNQAHYKSALPYFEKAIDIKPTNLEANNIFISSLVQTMATRGNAEDFTAELEGYSTKHTSLENNNIFNNLLANIYLSGFNNNYAFEKTAAGEKFRANFENQMAKHPDISFNTELLGKAYSKAAVYYFKKGQIPKARSIIAKGLTYSPNNYELLMRQRMIN